METVTGREQSVHEHVARALAQEISRIERERSATLPNNLWKKMVRKVLGYFRNPFVRLN